MLWDVRPRQIAGPEDAMVDEIAEGKIVHAVSGADPSDRTLAGDRSDRVQRAFDQVSFASRVEIRQRSVDGAFDAVSGKDIHDAPDAGLAAVLAISKRRIVRFPFAATIL